MADRDIKGNVAIVTGASKGIGNGIASKLASNGVHVYLVARNEADLQAAQAGIQAAGGRADYYSADITKLEEVKSVINKVYERTGRLDIFVNNAGEWKLQTIGEDPESLRRMRDLTGRAPSEITEYLVHLFQNSEKELRILNVSSQAGWKFLPGNLGYGVGKKQLAITLVELQGEMDHHKIKHIHLYGLYPGTVATPGVMEAIKKGELEHATTLDSVVDTAFDLLMDRTITRHAYVGYEPGRGILRRYLFVKPEIFRLLPQLGPEHIVDREFKPQDLIK